MPLDQLSMALGRVSKVEGVLGHDNVLLAHQNLQHQLQLHVGVGAAVQVAAKSIKQIRFDIVQHFDVVVASSIFRQFSTSVRR